MISPVGISWILNSIMMPVSLPFPSSESPGGFLSTLHLFFQVNGKKSSSQEEKQKKLWLEKNSGNQRPLKSHDKYCSNMHF